MITFKQYIETVNEGPIWDKIKSIGKKQNDTEADEEKRDVSGRIIKKPETPKSRQALEFERRQRNIRLANSHKPSEFSKGRDERHAEFDWKK